MEKKVKEHLEPSQDELEAVARIIVPAQQAGESCIYDIFSIRGIRAQPGFVVCTLKVPPRLTGGQSVKDHSEESTTIQRKLTSAFMIAGNLAQGAIANLVDVVGASVAYIHGVPMNVSVDISISYMSKAKLDGEVEITSKRLGQKGGYTGIIVLLRNKATGGIIAEGRHSMFRIHTAPKL